MTSRDPPNEMEALALLSYVYVRMGHALTGITQTTYMHS